MNPLSVHFLEFYRRHLRRHSEFGINVLHQASIVGIYLSLLALGLMLPYAFWIVGGVLAAYLLKLFPNLPSALSRSRRPRSPRLHGSPANFPQSPSGFFS